VVLATDGLRSAMVRSAPIDLPEAEPRVAIVRPIPSETFLPDHPISLVGAAFDIPGHAVYDDGLVWTVDGHVVARGQRVAATGSLGPAEHRVELMYGTSEATLAHADLTLGVPGRTRGQEAWLRISSGDTSLESLD
jgi:hypothetical protein